MIQIKITDDDRKLDFHLSVEPHCDDAGRYVEPNEVILGCVVVWIGKRAVVSDPETMTESRAIGKTLEAKYAADIDEAVRKEIERLKEPRDE